MDAMPRLLILSASVWVENTSSGNTFSNMFGFWDTDKIAMLYTKSAVPQNSICKRYFRMSEGDVIRSYLRKDVQIGDEIFLDEASEAAQYDQVEIADRVKAIPGKKLLENLLLLGREVLWCGAKWKTKALDDFLESFAPEVIFVCGYGSPSMNQIEQYVINKTGAKAVFFIGDDWYSLRQVNFFPSFWIKRFWGRVEVRKTSALCQLHYTMAPMIKKQFDKYLHIDSKILAKSGTFTKLPQYNRNTPLKLVYTGNMFCGRWRSLGKIAEALETINANKTVAELYIYSVEKPTKKQLRLLNRPGSSYFMGGIPASKVAEVQNEADVLIFVESFNLKDRYISWLSFSTKIVDYFERGKCIFAIGWKKSSPIDYLIRNDAAVVATNNGDISPKIKALIESEGMIEKYRLRAFNLGKKNHAKENVESSMLHDLKELCQ